VTIFNQGQLSAGIIAGNAQQRLVALRSALESVADLYAWSAGVAPADLEGAGFNAADAATLQSAIADANALAQIYATGLPPSTYPQPSSAYVYAASQRQVIGPQ